MFDSQLRSKRIWIPTVATVAALGVGATAWATSASGDALGGTQRDRVVAAAQQAAGPGTVVSAETSDRDRDDRDADRKEAYEVEIRKADGTEVDVTLDKDLTVIGQEAGDDTDEPEADERALSASERKRAEHAATQAVGGGIASHAEASGDRGVAYEVEVRTSDGTEWDVDLDSAFAVVHKSIDR